jgi:hypothetical protein
MDKAISFKVNRMDVSPALEVTVDGKPVSGISGFNIHAGKDTVLPEAEITVNGDYLDNGFDVEFPPENVKVCIVEDKADQRYYDFFKQMESYFKQNVDIEKARFLHKGPNGQLDGYTESEKHLSTVRCLLGTCERERKFNTPAKDISEVA